MASLKIHFPERQEPTLFVLRGPRLTVGRKPNNTIQIADRTISSQHAEFILEDGHYRIRDLNSTNGIFVNGDRVQEFHLREACALKIGSFECEFILQNGEPGSDSNVELAPTRAEIKALRAENVELLIRVATLTEQIAEVRTTSPSERGVPLSEFQRVVAERAELKQALHRREQEIQSLRSELAILERDRDSYRMHYSLLAKGSAARARGEQVSSTAIPVAVAVPSADASGGTPSNVVPLRPAQVLRSSSSLVPVHRPGGKPQAITAKRNSGKTKSATRAVRGQTMVSPS